MIQIRPYEKNDFPALCKVHDPARRQELHSAQLDAAFIPLAKAAFREDLFGYQIYVAQIKEKVVGFVAFTKHELAWLYVASAYQKRGIGGQLIDLALQKTARPLYLEVLKGNPAIHLYKHKGFRRQKEESGKMPGNEKFSVTVTLMVYN